MYKELTKANVKLQTARINSTLWTKGDILAFAKMLNSYRFSSKERQKQIMDLWAELKDGYTITQEQSQYGINWLNKLLFTTKGKNRESKIVSDFMERDFDIVRNFSYFTFEGFHESSNGYASHFSPIYRCIDKQGNYFDYVARMWQSPEIVNRGKVHTKLEKVLC